MTRRLLLTLALAALSPGLASAQGPPCPEFPVSPSAFEGQGGAEVASDANGNFVVVWNGSDASYFGIQARRFNAGGVPLGPRFLVNTYLAANQYRASVASDADGDFVVTWESDAGQDGHRGGIFGQRFDGAGVRQGTEFRVNAQTLGHQYGPSVAAAPGGSFVVVWTTLDSDQYVVGRFGQRFDAAGAPAGAEFTLPGSGSGPKVAVGPGGDFVVVWNDLGEVRGQRYDSAGVAQGPTFPVNTHEPNSQVNPRVAFSASGNFAVVWESWHQDGDGPGIFGQRYDAAGSAQGPEFRVNALTTGQQRFPAVTFDATGGFVVVWQSAVGLHSRVFGRRFSATGVPEGSDFPLGTPTTENQVRASVAAVPHRGFVATWESGVPLVSPFRVLASVDCARLYTVAPCRLADTRDPTGPSGGPALGANTTRAFPISGNCNIPADARAVALNVTAVNPADFGFLNLYPAGQAAPLASTVNFVAGRTRANNAIVSLGADGQAAVHCVMPSGSNGATHLVLDVFGYFKR